jgi:hypothetical protein
LVRTVNRRNFPLNDDHGCLVSAKEEIISRVVVTFDYTSQQPDELNLKKGYHLDIVAKDDEG